MYFFPIKINNLDQIQNEVIKIIQKDHNDISKITTNFYPGKTNLFKIHCNNLRKFLVSKSLYHRYTSTGLSILNQKIGLNTIHTDSINPSRIFSLNIPILNCENTYTIWYHVEPNSISIQESSNSFGNDVISFTYEKNKAKEVCRLETNIPAFINIKIPHTGVTYHNNIRILMSLRFTPEITLDEIKELCND